MNATIAIAIGVTGVAIGWTIMVIQEIRQGGPTVKLIRQVARDRRAGVIALIFPVLSIVASIIEQRSITFGGVISALLAALFGLVVGVWIAIKWPWRAYHHSDKNK